MKFGYVLTGIGWSDGKIEINNQISIFCVSYITNALDDLLESFLCIIPGCVPDDDLRETVSFNWYSEPGGKQWTFSLVSEVSIRIRIVTYPRLLENDKSDENVELDTTCNIIEFAQLLCRVLEDILKIHGVTGYKQTWLFDFPLSNYLRLKNFLRSRQIKYDEVKIDGWREVYISNLDEELQILKKLTEYN